MKERYKENAENAGCNLAIPTNTHKDSTSHGDGIGISKESTNILDPLVTRSKGRPPSKRRVGNVEKAVKKKAKTKKNYEHGTQESIVLNSSPMRSNLGVGGNFAVQPNLGVGGFFMGQPNVGVGGHFVGQPNLGVGGHFVGQPNLGNFPLRPNIGLGEVDARQFQGYYNPYWRVGYDFTNMHLQTSDRGLCPEENEEEEESIR